MRSHAFDVASFGIWKIALGNGGCGDGEPCCHSAAAHALHMPAPSKEVRSRRRPLLASSRAPVRSSCVAALLASRADKNMSSRLSTAQNKQVHMQICATNIFQPRDLLSTKRA